MKVYLDNAATTKCYDEVANIVLEVMTKDYGNPSSMHHLGVEAEKYIKDAKNIIAKEMKVEPKEIYFTSGGTESNNWAIIGVAMANKRRGNHIITTQIEHPAVSSPMAYLEAQGFEITRIGVDKQGKVNANDIKAAITDKTILASVMCINNEIGSIQPIAEIGSMLRNFPDVYFHVDAIQAFGKYSFLPKQSRIDLASVSGHKLHGPKGIGFLYINERVRISPIIYGGGQQKDMRSGTENVLGIAGLGAATKISCDDLYRKQRHLFALKKALVEGLTKLENVTIHGMRDRNDVLDIESDWAPHIVSVAFNGVRSEVMLHTLEDKGIYISAGSACSTHKRSQSPTLIALGANKEQLESTVRFSFSNETTMEEIEYTLNVLAEVLPLLRRYMRR